MALDEVVAVRPCGVAVQAAALLAHGRAAQHDQPHGDEVAALLRRHAGPVRLHLALARGQQLHHVVRSAQQRGRVAHDARGEGRPDMARRVTGRHLTQGTRVQKARR